MEPNSPPGADPYAPPKSDVNADLLPPSHGVRLADRGKRLAGAILDGLLYMPIMIPIIVMGMRSGAFSQQSGKLSFFRLFVDSPVGIAALVAWVALTAVQAYLVATTGQSIAKRWLKTKIVKMDGSPVGFMSGVVTRNWLLMVLQQLPVVSAVLPWVDSLLIFRQDRRCLHDHIAGTKVIQLP